MLQFIQKYFKMRNDQTGNEPEEGSGKAPEPVVIKDTKNATAKVCQAIKGTGSDQNGKGERRVGLAVQDDNKVSASASMSRKRDRDSNEETVVSNTEDGTPGKKTGIRISPSSHEKVLKCAYEISHPTPYPIMFVHIFTNQWTVRSCNIHPIVNLR